VVVNVDNLDEAVCIQLFILSRAWLSRWAVMGWARVDGISGPADVEGPGGMAEDVEG